MANDCTLIVELPEELQGKVAGLKEGPIGADPSSIIRSIKGFTLGENSITVSFSEEPPPDAMVCVNVNLKLKSGAVEVLRRYYTWSEGDWRLKQ